jgi:hypothetical protein
MKLLRKPGKNPRGGWAMLLVGIALIAGSTMAAMLMVTGTVTSRSANTHRHQVRAWYLAEGAVEAAKKELLEAVAGFEAPPETGTVTIDGREIAYNIEATGFNQVQTDPAGIQTIVTGYEIGSTVDVEGFKSTAHRVVNVDATPIFQFAVFYDDDLEIFPGANMTIGGRVHTNADLYLGSNATLTMDTNYVRAIGDIYRRRKDDPSASPGTVSIRQWVANPFDASEPAKYVTMNSDAQMTALGVDTPSGYDSAFTMGYDANGDGDFYDTKDWLPWAPGALDYWSEPDGYSKTGTTVMSGVHGTSEAVPPHVGSTHMFEESAGGSYNYDSASGKYVKVAAGTGAYDMGFYHATADLSIITNKDGTWKATKADGTDVSSSLTGVVKVTKLLDTRQSDGTSTKVTVTEVDVKLLNASGVFPKNGLLYTASYNAGTGTSAKGTVLKNGSELKAPLTVVTENSLYVQGDYNTVNKKGAAVIADAVNLLSKGWDGTKTTSGLPNAKETTYNLAFITGNNETVGSKYNGGLENLPRFHENWTGINCNLNGSFVNAWASTYATGAWVYGGNRYTAPNRKFTYDKAFNSVANLPPFTPMVVSSDEVVSW